MNIKKELVSIGMILDNKPFFIGSKDFSFSFKCESCHDLNSDDFSLETFVLIENNIFKYVFDQYGNEDLKETSLNEIKKAFELGFLFN